MQAKHSETRKINSRLLIFLLLLAVAFGMSTFSRNLQRELWAADPTTFYNGDTPVVSTLDAYKWVRIADEYRNDAYIDEMDDLMYYPDGHKTESPTPMLSILLAFFARFFDGNLYEAGLWLIPWLAGLFMIPFAVYFYRLGYPVAGLLGAVLGTFCMMYYMRTSPGRIDTDALNLFFPCLTALFILLATEKGVGASSPIKLVYCALAGFSQNMFYWWYQHAAFILIFFVAFVAVLVLAKLRPQAGDEPFDYKNAALALALYIICANPYWFALSIGNSIDLLTAYFFKPDSLEGGFPNVYQTVTEARQLPIKELMQTIFISPVVAIFAFIGLGLMTYRHLRAMLPILPVCCLGLLVFVGSVRFSVFLVPFLALGLGYLINFAVLKIPAKLFESHTRKELLGYMVAALFVFAIDKAQMSGIVLYTTPSISISPQVLGSFEHMGETLPAGSAIYTWWDYGLAIEAESGLATFHDGMTQNTLKTWVIARSFAEDQANFARYVRYIANEGMPALNTAVDSGTKATEIVSILDSYAEPLHKKNVYISFSPDMIQKYVSINYIGSWNIVDGMPSRDSAGIDVLSCNTAGRGELLCNGMPVSLGTGMLNGAPLKRVDYLDISQGRVTLSTDWHSNSDVSAVVLQEGGTTHMIFLASEKVYQSAFFQLYIRGNYDSELFEEVINNFPLSKVYRLK
ncbi:MAG: dolichyl-diphosphooligosaccharide--protein glycosyltransferase subunit STT3 [Deferribacteraceae bacterium]|jgi:dolichyl-diphosphooligosaccharide--protein glycosyltransferase|nr:dolichyl-diphosphooligosaccharide--protein glycosyltransferase subunit STT3 [Deferribacteraceae bacterium]